MLLGIDVGGTFTDAVIIEDEKIISQAKEKTTHEDILIGLLNVLNEVIKPINDVQKIKRVSLSTTLITNLVATGNLPKVSLGVVPGPGVNCEDSFPVKPIIFDGYTDHRGEMVAPSQSKGEQVKKMLESDFAVVSAKFSVRNRQSELDLTSQLKAQGVKNIVMGHKVAGNLGFIRRTNSAYYTAATFSVFEVFIASIKKALAKYKISAPVYVLKADGGTMRVNDKFIEEHTVETYFTGPAASAVGINALLEPKKRAISLDIGGTTTDIAFWENGVPVHKQKGATIEGYPTAVRSLHLRSVALGGDSVIKRSGDDITIGPERLGSAVALGGKEPTLTDAFLVLAKADFGDKAKAIEGLQSLLKDDEDVEVFAQKILAKALDILEHEIEDMVKEYALQPIYRVEDVVAERVFTPELLIGVGGAALGIVPSLAERLDLPVEVPQSAVVANAVGAAVARPNLVADLRADTAAGVCTIVQKGVKEQIASSFSLEDAQNMLTEWLKEQAQENQIDFLGVQVITKEEFPVVKGMRRLGRIINMTMQLASGVLSQVKEAKQ